MGREKAGSKQEGLAADPGASGAPLKSGNASPPLATRPSCWSGQDCHKTDEGVFGADEDEVKPVSVMEGDSVTLNPDLTKIQGFNQILWRFGSQGSTIARIVEKVISDEEEEIFRGRLQLDQTGSLTIKNMKTKHSGRYKAEISHSAGALFTIFIVTVYESPAVVDPAKGEMKIVSVTEGDPVTLQTDVTELQGDELIVWRSGDLIAKHDTEAKSSRLYDTEERFRDRLQLNDQTGSLIITNTRTTDSGPYTVKISSRKQTSDKRFTVSDSGLSPYAIAWIVVVVLLVSAAAVGLMYLCRPRTTNLPGQTWSVLPGDDITLNPETEIQTSDEIQWLHGDEETLIAGIRRDNREMNTYWGPDEIFTYRLKLDKTTGSLTIKLIDTEHAGLYTLKIRRGRETLHKRFMVSIEERKIRVTEGDPVTLYSDTVIQTDDEMQWLFDDEEQQTVLAEIKTTEVTKYDGPDERFRDRLELGAETGSLTVTKYTAAHSGVYTLKIRRGTETSYRRFYISVEPREIEVMEGKSVTLNPATEINKDDVILWLFSDEEQQTLIAEIKGETKVFTRDDAAGGRFRDRLKLDETTGSLTINNTRTTDSGAYKLQITSSRGASDQTFIVTIKDKVEKKLLNEGDSVTLNPDTEIQRDDQILWMFGAQDDLIAQIRGGTVEIYDDGINKIFRDRLKLDRTTGSLTITDISTEHTGLYKLLTISSSRGILFKKFKVLIHLEYVSVTAGESVTLKTGLTGEHTADEIQWRFGDENSLIAEIKGGTGKTHVGPDERLRDRLMLNNTTGDLTIKNSTAEHAGCYKLKIRSSEGDTSRTYIVNIRVRYKTVTTGESVTLKTGLYNIQTDDEIQWRFGDENYLIAEIKEGTVETYNVPDERFRDRPELNETTGDLIISNSTTKHAGCYKVKIHSSEGDTSRTYSVFIRGAAVTNEARKKSETKEKNDSRENRENESATVEIPLLNGEDVGWSE
ncbi:uncharacterized protein LOC131530976 [Onychostoma macrolepis]|uniref:uncharacterized protein LOC131530976 n=1 Tax=Onychostoma macrolepis TaxID=369639 RepID=UPI00272BA0E3|nr:uncharacterized protein LOC131530976 [Onychostoma macrolepis]